jgi:hypothetical protein
MVLQATPCTTGAEARDKAEMVRSNPQFGLYGKAAIAGTFSLFILVFTQAVRSAPPVPLGDSFLTESLHYPN